MGPRCGSGLRRSSVVLSASELDGSTCAATASHCRSRRRDTSRRLPRSRTHLKKIGPLVDDIRAVVPEATVEVWAQDEARLGLKPITRRCWAKKGQRPLAVQHPGYDWLYLYGFVRPATGDVEWLLLPVTVRPEQS